VKKSIDDQTVQLRDEKLKADQAKTVLENPVFKAASESVTKELFDSWLSTAPGDVESREWFHKLAIANVRLVQVLSHTMQTGEMADLTLTKLNERAPRRK